MAPSLVEAARVVAAMLSRYRAETHPVDGVEHVEILVSRVTFEARRSDLLAAIEHADEVDLLLGEMAEELGAEYPLD